jgi:hypothetical protein
MTEADIADLRERLIAMRADLAERLAARIDGGIMALLGSVHAALVAVDSMQAEPRGEPGRQGRSAFTTADR